MDFIYDADGQPYAMMYGNKLYYYILNLQGDVIRIIRIISTNGTKVVKYKYDLWGKPTVISGTTIANANPLRYRGYYYDTDTGFYYVSSRYYDPAIGRFINADDPSYLGANGDFISYNLFAYCGNNPVMGYDPTGHWDWKAQMAMGVSIFVVGIALLLAPPTGGSSLAFGALALSSTSVLAAGGAMAITGTVVVGDALNQATTNYANQGKNNSNSKQEDNYRGNSLYNKNGERIDYEYYGNGNGNVHYDGTKGKEILWRLENGVETMYVASKAVRKIIKTPQIQKAIHRAIDVVLSLAGIN